MVEKITLDNGVRVLLDPMEHLRSVSVGIWVAAGSRREAAEENGICHFVEHMLFKGTERRSARQIAMEIDSVGGLLNGFTSRECSSFYVKVIDEHLPVALDLLADIYLNSTFDPQELERERNVIIQEIRMVEDTPDEHVMDLCANAFWKDSPMGLPVQGAPNTVSTIAREDLLNTFHRRYCHEEVLISICGSFNAKDVIRMLDGRLGPLAAPADWPKTDPPEPHPGLKVVEKDLEQVQVCLSMPGPSAVHPDRYAYSLMNTILGGGMSSYLFQEVREKRGLVYNVYSYLGSYSDTGILGIYLGTSPEELNEALTVVLEQMEILAGRPVDEQILRAAREQIKSGIVLGLESSDRRMSRQAKNELYFGRDVTIEEVIERLEAVNAEDVMEAARSAFAINRMGGIILGNASADHLPKEMRDCLEN